MDSFYLGQINLFGFSFPPRGWMFCEGQLLDISRNQALYSVLGTTYGGDGRTNFALPNLKGKEPVPGMHYCIAIEMGIFPPRN